MEGIRIEECKLLEDQTKALLEKLAQNPEAIQVKAMAFDWLCGDGNEEVQIQIIVTRDQNDFLEPFDLEITEDYE